MAKPLQLFIRHGKGPHTGDERYVCKFAQETPKPVWHNGNLIPWHQPRDMSKELDDQLEAAIEVSDGAAAHVVSLRMADLRGCIAVAVKKHYGLM